MVARLNTEHCHTPLSCIFALKNSLHSLARAKEVNEIENLNVAAFSTNNKY